MLFLTVFNKSVLLLVEIGFCSLDIIRARTDIWFLLVAEKIWSRENKWKKQIITNVMFARLLFRGSELFMLTPQQTECKKES